MRDVITLDEGVRDDLEVESIEGDTSSTLLDGCLLSQIRRDALVKHVFTFGFPIATCLLGDLRLPISPFDLRAMNISPFSTYDID